MKKLIFIGVMALLCMTRQVYAGAEFYLKINISGTHTVSIGDQRQTSPTNEFRFHDLNAGTWTFSVSGETDKSLLNYSITLINGHRTVAEINSNTYITTLGNLPVDENYWYADYLLPYFGVNTNNNQPTVGIDSYTFGLIKDYVKKQYSDADKLKAAKETTKDMGLSSSQTAGIAKLFYSETERLEYAKFAYDFVVDKPMYFLVSATFYSSSDVDKLREYIANH